MNKWGYLAVTLGAGAAIFYFAANPEQKTADLIETHQPKVESAQKVESIRSAKVIAPEVMTVSKPADMAVETQPVSTLVDIVDHQAMASFALSATMDDPRAPPIDRRPVVPSPAQEILDDPELYQQHEAGLRRKALQRFVNEGLLKIKKLEQLIAQGKAKGISEQQLQQGLKKLAALKDGVKQVEQSM